MADEGLQRLDRYRLPADYSPGAPWSTQLLWFCLGAPLLSARWLPGSAWRRWLLIGFGARLGRGCRLKPGLRVKFPWRLRAGAHCWLGEDVWIDNLARVMPKGKLLPLPLLCTATFGAPLRLQPEEDKTGFLARAREALIALSADAAAIEPSGDKP